MTGSRVIAIIGLVGLVGLVVMAGALVLTAWSPSVPVDAAALPITRTTLSGTVDPDPVEGTDVESLARSPAGQECLAIVRPAGPLSLCWEAHRDPRESDPTKDYYRLRLYGTFGGDSGSGVRWVVARARLVGEPADRVFEARPIGTFDGPCTQVDLSIGHSDPGSTEWLCGRTVGAPDPTGWGHTATWTCQGCLIADHADRAISLVEWVAVPEGDVPAWDIYADLGG